MTRVPRVQFSVRSRVAVGATLVIAAALVLAAFATAGLLRRALTRDAQTLLIDRIDEVERSITNGQLQAILAADGRKVGQLQVFDDAGGLVAATPGLAPTVRLDVLLSRSSRKSGSAQIHGRLVEGEPNELFQVETRTIEGPSGTLTIFGATSLEPAQSAERYLRNALLTGLPVLAALAALLIWRVVGRALAPVEMLRSEVDRIEATDLSGRVPERGHDEIAKLAVTLNRMLSRLEESAKRQQLFAAAASHELRSPLSAMRTELEVGLAYPDRAEWPIIAEEALDEVGRLERLARDLRILTRLPHRNTHRITRAPLSSVVCTEIDRRQATDVVYTRDIQQGIDIDAAADDLLHVLRNLFDNAERHALREIAVTLRREGTRAVLSVRNDGEPLASSDRESIFEPFFRLDEARALDAGGSGLGLAIAQAAARSLGGSLEAMPLDRGAEFRASFPLLRQ